MVLVQDEVCSVPMKKLLRFRFSHVKTRVWEQKRWNRWDLVTQVEGMEEAWMGTWSLNRAAFDLALCHMLRNVGKRSGVPEDPGRYAELDYGRASEGRHRTPMRKKIHPRCRSSPSRHQSRMRMIDLWRFRHGTDFGYSDDMRGIEWGGW